MWLLSWVRRSTTRQQKAAIAVYSIIILVILAVLIRVDINLIAFGWKFFIDRAAGVGATPDQ